MIPISVFSNQQFFNRLKKIVDHGNQQKNKGIQILELKMKNPKNYLIMSLSYESYERIGNKFCKKIKTFKKDIMIKEMNLRTFSQQVFI